jgi:iron complex outermembrane receptor protein
MSRIVSLTAVLLSAAFAMPAFAEDAPGDDIVVTAQKNNQTEVSRKGDLGALGNQDAMSTPFMVKSYNAALILNQQPQTLGQVLENDPSIRTSYGFGNAAEQFVIRGFTLYGDDIGLNGLFGIAPRQLIAPELYESVQVLNGASAFLYGAAPGGSGLGGNVNLVTKQAGRTPLTRVTANFASAGHVGGSFDVARRTDDRRWGFRINGVARAGDVAVNDEYRSIYTAGAAIDYDGGNLKIGLDLDYQHVHIRDLRTKVTIATTTIPAVPKASHNYGQKFTYTTLRDVFGTLRVDWDVAPNASFYVRGGARDGMEKGIYGGITVLNALTGAANGNALYVPRTDNNEAMTAGFRAKLGSVVTQQFNLGVSGIWQVNRNAYDFRYGPGFAGFATNIYTTPQVALPSSSLVGGNLADPQPRTRSFLGSAFASDTVGFLDDRILITGGLRLQKIKQTSYVYGTGAIESLYDRSAVTPVVGVVAKPADHVSIYFNRIEGLQQGPQAPLDATISNPGQVFAPYRTVQYELGGKLEVGRINLTGAVYQTTLPVAYAAPQAGTLLLRYDLNGEQRNRGIELSLDGEVTKGLRVIAGGSVNSAKLQKTLGGLQNGNKAVGVPDYTINGNVEWDTPFVPKLTLTGRVVQTGKQWVNTTNTLSIPSWTRFDLGARYVAVIANRPVTFRATVDNVANKRYWASALDTFAQALLQGAPRTFKLSTTVDF